MKQPELSSSFLMAAYSVLRHQRHPLSARNITNIAMDEGYLDRDRRGGSTPIQTMKSKLSVHIRRYGDASVFVRTGPGKFYLRELLSTAVAEYRSPPFRAGPPDERIIVFDQEVLDGIGRFQGVSRNWQPYFEGLAREPACRELDRMVAEDDDGVKQLLTYTLVRRSDGAVLCFDRGVINRVDQELRGRSCIGFGGHVKSIPSRLLDPDYVGLYRGAAKELTEELRIPQNAAKELLDQPAKRLKLIGVINDDSSPNGVRHFAFVFQYDVPDEPIWSHPRGREKSIARVRWLSADSADVESVHQFEFWSQLCLREYAGEFATATPSYRVRRPRVLSSAKLLCLVGQIGSGKTEAATRFRERFNFGEVNSGRVVAELLGIPAIPDTPREVFQPAAEDFIRRVDGPDRLGAAIAAKASARSGRVLIDGVRQLETLDSLRRHVGTRGLAVVYVHAPFDIAFEMYRNREDPNVSMTAFARFRTAPVESQVSQMVDIADAAIYNWIGLGAFSEVLDEFGDAYLVRRTSD